MVEVSCSAIKLGSIRAGREVAEGRGRQSTGRNFGYLQDNFCVVFSSFHWKVILALREARAGRRIRLVSLA